MDDCLKILKKLSGGFGYILSKIFIVISQANRKIFIRVHEYNLHNILTLRGVYVDKQMFYASEFNK